MKTSELTGTALNWAVATCEKEAGMNIREGYGGSLLVVDANDFGAPANYSTDWAQGGPIIERDEIDIAYCNPAAGWSATGFRNTKFGPTPLIAAMRCYVASKLGDNVDIPEELTS
jgi:hypothetical protein